MNHDYYKINRENLGENGKVPILKVGSSGEAFYEMAIMMFNEIKKNNSEGKKTVFILPVGPIGQYPIFVRLVNENNLSLKNCWFFNMDEYLDENDNWIDIENRLSFRGFMNKNLYNCIKDELLMPEDQRIFPDPKDPEIVDRKLKELGGADICFGGIGITGHLAFNEPDPSLSPEEFAALPTRKLNISDETRACNSIGDLGGALEDMPVRCITIGMKNIMRARKIRLAVFRDWHRAVCRRAIYGEISSEFPVTLAQKHKDTLIIINDVAAQQAY